ncbi:ATP-grasp domain-containing protein [Planctomicrobium piriforme]|uniref:Predicted ATP-dependent carboligase, ATP-grasp superfamily n=1 Tax=Planctomicrobium piriforme TaxID=1576369 RepID=A0A1I3SQZ1_9PLAN|nr:ATP-grasp domain-containing protein [Planctomicrobium piriforme]SFJ61224.1 Predicted ATP-dependent carboligase, ATP-grasp superfamily [Planctomicrobium piriforme]
MIQSADTSVDLLIVGASARAAAFSAIRAGFRPLCLDLYADADLRAHASFHILNSYPDGILAELKRFPGLPVVYTGGMENNPDLLDAIGKTNPLWGNDSAAVGRVRSLPQLTEAARLARVRLPDYRDQNNPPPPDGNWLLRPLASSGGRGISLWTEDQQASPTLQEPHCFQQRIDGIPYSAAFIGSPESGDVRFIGMTRQLIGEADCHATGYQWCGNIGPVALSVAVENLIRRFGNVLKWKLGLKGLYGVDLMIDSQDVPWITEVNPRYPASIELLEHVTGIPFMREHCRCFAKEDLPSTNWNRAHPGEFLGKAVLYSPADLQLQSPLADAHQVPVREVPEVTDLPLPGGTLRRGEPVCTVFGESASVDLTLALLHQHLGEMTARLQSLSTPAG